MSQLFADAARAELAASLNSADTALTITTGGSLFPVANTGAVAVGPAADWFKLVLQDDTGIEIVYCRTHTSGSNTFSNLLRGQDGTTARGFVPPAVVGVRPMASDSTRFEAAAESVDSHTVNTSNPHSVTKSQVGLANVDNTSDANKPVSTAQQTALNLKAPLASPTFTGTVGGITKAMVGLSSVDNTTDAGKPVSTAQQTALNLKANLASPAFTGTPTGITKTHVGLGNVDNTTDAGKPVSTAQQTALNLKANLASPTFTGTVGGITKTMVGLGSVDNVSAASLRDRSTHTGAQAISTVTGLQTALDQINTRQKQQFAAGTGFTAGTSTTVTLTETPIAPNKDSLLVYFDGAYQQESEWGYNSTTGVITFNSAIPSGVAKIEATWGASLDAGVASSVVGQTGIGTALLTAADAAAGRAALALEEQVATESTAGLLKVATQAQTDTGTDDATIVTPKKMRWGVSWLTDAIGYVAFPSWLGGFIIQWGNSATTASGANTPGFAVPFPNIMYTVSILQTRTAVGGVSFGWSYASLGAINVYASAAGIYGYYYIAIGR